MKIYLVYNYCADFDISAAFTNPREAIKCYEETDASGIIMIDLDSTFNKEKHTNTGGVNHYLHEKNYEQILKEYDEQQNA